MATGVCVGSMVISIPPFTECLEFLDFVWYLQRGDTGDKNANAKKKWFEEKQKRKHAELEKLGLDTTEIHRIETAEQVGNDPCHAVEARCCPIYLKKWHCIVSCPLKLRLLHCACLVSRSSLDWSSCTAKYACQL